MAETEYEVVTKVARSGRFRYAEPRELPSFPSKGLRDNDAAASAAASLGWANQKPVQTWKPDKSASASAAAVLAKDLKKTQSWDPSTAQSSSSRAALLAAESAGKSKLSAPPAHTRASSASNPSMNQVPAARRQPAKVASQTSDGSLAAAKDAMSASRPRSKSTPQPRKVSGGSGQTTPTSNALSAATIAHRPSMKPNVPIEEGGAVPYTNLPRKMFTSTPLIGPEADDKRKSDTIHASALAMARQMYDHQQKMADATSQAHGRSTRDQEGTDQQTKPYVNLQEAAYQLAQERLSKLHGEHQKTREYQEYYGSSAQNPRRSTVMSKLRRRASSDSDMIVDDHKQSEKIRQQMSIFSNKLTEVDEKKRAKDREAVLAAAQRNVRAQLDGMDQKMYHDTGRVAPSLMSEWEAKATAIARAKHQGRTDNRTKVDIGGGKFMERDEVNAIAVKKVQPILDDIHERAEKERERQAALKAEMERKKEQEEVQRAREREVRELHQKLKDQNRQEVKEKRREEKEEEKEEKKAKKEEGKIVKEKRREEKDEEKEEKKAKKEEDKIVKAEEKAARADEKAAKVDKRRLSRGEKHRPADLSFTHRTPTSDTEDVDTTIATTSATTEGEKDPKTPTRPTVVTGSTTPKIIEPTSSSPADPTSPAAKVKDWFKSRFSRPRGKSASEADKGFIGGAALRQQEVATHSSVSLNNRPSSMRDVAMAGRRAETSARDDGEGADGDGDDVSSMSSGSSSEIFVEARTGLVSPGSLAPPRSFRDLEREEGGSPTRDSRFREIM